MHTLKTDSNDLHKYDWFKIPFSNHMRIIINTYVLTWLPLCIVILTTLQSLRLSKAKFPQFVTNDVKIYLCNIKMNLKTHFGRRIFL